MRLLPSAICSMTVAAQHLKEARTVAVRCLTLAFEAVTEFDRYDTGGLSRDEFIGKIKSLSDRAETMLLEYRQFCSGDVLNTIRAAGVEAGTSICSEPCGHEVARETLESLRDLLVDCSATRDPSRLGEFRPMVFSVQKDIRREFERASTMLAETTIRQAPDESTDFD